MNKFAYKVLCSALYRLNTINDRIEKKKIEENEQNWVAKFKSKGCFDYELQSDLKIRLYRDSVLSKLIYEGFENEELDFLRHFLREGDTFFDIGANVGLFSLIASVKVGNKGKIFAFEPSPQTFARLSENIVLNNIDNVKLFNLGLSDQTGKLKLNISESGYDAWNSFAGDADDKFQASVEVNVETLDRVIIDNNIDNVDLIKLDVEGWEKYVIHGGESYLKLNAPVLMVEFTEANTFSAGYHVQELYDILESWGYKWYRYTDGVMIYERKKLHYPYDNLFAIKDISLVHQRINEKKY